MLTVSIERSVENYNGMRLLGQHAPSDSRFIIKIYMCISQKTLFMDILETVIHTTSMEVSYIHTCRHTGRRKLSKNLDIKSMINNESLFLPNKVRNMSWNRKRVARRVRNYMSWHPLENPNKVIYMWYTYERTECVLFTELVLSMLHRGLLSTSTVAA